jgi:hypothetical protein
MDNVVEDKKATEILVKPQFEDIRNLILTIREKQVLLDSDIARLYGCETKVINQAASRNIKRFPSEFRFQLLDEEVDDLLKSQFVTSKLIVNGSGLITQVKTSSPANKQKRGGRRKPPFVYTEQGIGMLSGLLRNDTAIQVSIGIMNAFVEMRQFLYANRDVFANIVNINRRLREHDDMLLEQSAKFDEVFDLLQQPETVKQSVFYKGQFYDAYQLIRDIIKQAKASIIIIDNYIDDTLLDTLASKSKGVIVTIITSSVKKVSPQALAKFNKQYGEIRIVISKDFHDRFIVLDNKEVYALGASIKDLGNKCFEISKVADTSHFCAYIKQVVNTTL